MSIRVQDGVEALTEKEKQTLRLIVRGHDAKSIARSLDLSVHTINERLRDARRKMAVSSSREAARLLLEAEGDPARPNPELLGDTVIGEAASDASEDQGRWRGYRHPWILIGVPVMIVVLGLLALAALPQTDSSPSPTPVAASAPRNSEATDFAAHWLTLLDERRWDESYQAASASMRKANTPQVWAKVHEQVRAPLGAVMSRTLTSEDVIPAPSSGYRLVKFRTRFANKGDVIETVALHREDGNWRVVSVTIE